MISAEPNLTSDHVNAKATQGEFSHDVTFIIPFYNELKFLGATLESLKNQRLDGIKMELLLVDGNSDDGSGELAESFAALPGLGMDVRVLKNPGRTAPRGFNLGIRTAKGLVISWGGGHSIFPPHYIRRGLQLLEEGHGEIVGGGPTKFVTTQKGIFAEAAACLYMSPLGAGVAAYMRMDKAGLVDTVYCPFYRREVFDRIGYFNENLTRNQDNEFHSRANKAGLRVYLHPDLGMTYVLKSNLKTFFRRGFRTGEFMLVSWFLTPECFTFRHLVPAMFVTFLGLLVAFPVLWPILALYGALLLWSASKLANIKGWLVGLATIPLFAGFHIAYGVGTWWGLLRFPALHARARTAIQSE